MIRDKIVFWQFCKNISYFQKNIISFGGQRPNVVSPSWFSFKVTQTFVGHSGIRTPIDSFNIRTHWTFSNTLRQHFAKTSYLYWTIILYWAISANSYWKYYSFKIENESVHNWVQGSLTILLLFSSKNLLSFIPARFSKTNTILCITSIPFCIDLT